MLTTEQIKTIRKLGLDASNFLAKGMECLVFDNADGTITKVYETRFGLDYIHRLKDFYDSLDTNRVSFRVPKIYDIVVEGEYILVTERKLEGKAFKIEELSELTKKEMARLLTNYTNTLFSVKEISTQFLRHAEPLNINNQFLYDGGVDDWNVLIKQSIQRKLEKTYTKLRDDVTDYDNKLATLADRFSVPYEGQYHLVHGDIFPSNLLVDVDMNVHAVLDFGILTVNGDYLFDIATGWVFIDMYHEVKKYPLKEMLGEKIHERLADKDVAAVYRYILVYSILSCDMYSSTCADGHYAWCVENLNDEGYWEKAGLK